MEAYSANNLVSNHLISDGREDVVLLDSAATISADLTEVTNEDQRINLRSARDEDVDSNDDEHSSDSSDEEYYDDGTKDETQHDRNRKHEVLPGSADDTKCKFSRSVALIDCSAP